MSERKAKTKKEDKSDKLWQICEERLAFLEKIIALMPAHVYWKDVNGVIRGSSDLQAQTLGYRTGQNIIGKTDYDFSWKEQAAILRTVDKEVMRTRKLHTVEEPASLPNGEKAVFLSKKIPLLNEKNKVVGILGISFDITDRKRLEQELKNARERAEDAEHFSAQYLANLSREVTGMEIDPNLSPKECAQNIKDYYDNLIALLPGHVYWMNRENVFLGCNDQQAKSAGLTSRHEIVGKTNYDMPWKEQAEALNAINNKVMETGKSHIAEEIAEMVYGKGVFLSHKIPLRDKFGRVIGLLGISFDITDRKQAEVLEKEKAIAQQKIKDLRILGGAIAHELRNPLGAITLQYDLIENELTTIIKDLLEENPKLYEEKYADHFVKTFAAGRQINNVIKRTATTIDLLLSNIREEEISAKKFKKASILADIKEVMEIYPFVGEEKQKVHYSEDKDFEYLGNSRLTRLILTNLLKNALYHIKLAGKGEIHITLRSDANNNYLVVHDTGPGIPEKLLLRIFDRFVTGRAGGTGLGLTFCKMVMQVYGGDITCDSKEGEFTEFVLAFPKVYS